MAVNKLDPCATPDDAACWSTPPEFVRLRYFFGQRLGVVDLTDEQAYAVGKQRFHNLRAHGAGVLCGLRAERFVFPAGAPRSTPTRVLLVRRGAALDGCGREIVVGWDQCIDVGAWFAKHLATSDDLQHWFDAGAAHALWLAVCYRECPSDPQPAPRDPCGCDPGGCELGRVREGFELKLLTRSELGTALGRTRPDGGARLQPERAVTEPLEAAIARYLNGLADGDCPEPDPACLFLARIPVEVDPSTRQVVSIGDPDNTILQRLTLLSTAELQRQLVAAMAASDGWFGVGPRLGTLSFTASGGDGTLSVDVELVGHGATATPLQNNAAKALSVSLCRFDDKAGDWSDKSLSVKASYVADGPRFDLAVKGLDAGRYRLVIESTTDKPVVDLQMRPLLPRRFARHFRLQGTPLALADTLYDA